MKNMHLPVFFLLICLLAGCAGATPSPTVVVVPPTEPPAPPTPTLPPTAAPTLIPPEQEAIPDVLLDGAIDLSGKWRFSQVKMFKVDMTRPEFDDSQWQEVDAPASWETQGMKDLVGTGSVVLYRRKVQVPADWQGSPVGIAAWFNPYGSQVFVNGQRVDPLRKGFAPYADITSLVEFGKENTVAVSTQYDGFLEFAETGPARIGLLGERVVTKVLHEEVSIDTPVGKADSVVIRPAEKKDLPALLLLATGSHGMAEVTSWLDVADDLARQGYVSLALGLPQLKAEGVTAGLKYLRGLEFVNPKKILVYAVDQFCSPVVQAVAADEVSALILLSAPQVIDEISQLSGRQILLLASTGDRKGLILEQTQTMAEKAGKGAQVVALPGEGHGTFIFTNTWNQLRSAVLGWLKSISFQ
jgi:hypothetical protein